MDDFIPKNYNTTGVFIQIIFVKQPQLKIIVFAGRNGWRELVNCYAYCYDFTFNFNYNLWKMFINAFWYTYMHTHLQICDRYLFFSTAVIL